ncbi:hypothetical protein KIPB_016606, partial [Kipferlia bialata]
VWVAVILGDVLGVGATVLHQAHAFSARRTGLESHALAHKISSLTYLLCTLILLGKSCLSWCYRIPHYIPEGHIIVSTVLLFTFLEE